MPHDEDSALRSTRGHPRPLSRLAQALASFATVARREARLWISRAFLDSSTIETVVPTPLRVEGGADRLYYVFQMAKPGDPLFVALNLQAERIGLVDGRIGSPTPSSA